MHSLKLLAAHGAECGHLPEQSLRNISLDKWYGTLSFQHLDQDRVSSGRLVQLRDDTAGGVMTLQNTES